MAGVTQEFTMFYPRELHLVRALFLAKEYRACINTCRQALSSTVEDQDGHPVVWQAFMHFYLGLAHDELARALHEHSTAKLPAFDHAEQHFRTAIDALPSVAQCRASLLARACSATAVDANRVHSATGDEPTDESLNDAGNAEETPSRPPHPLQRDYSSMSLLQAPPRLSKSTSQGLLRPIRPGSPPKQYHLPPRLPYVGSAQSRSYLPTLLTKSTPVYRARSRLGLWETSPTSPVSPLGSEIFSSDISSTVSPMAPLTPEEDPSPKTSLGTPRKFPNSTTSPALNLHHIEIHLDALCTQLQTHLRLLQHARLRTTIAQAERSVRTTSISLQRLRATETSRPGSGLQGTRSFWSFTPVDVKAEEKQRRIEEGRARGWERKRFRPERYRDLAERAIAEL